MTDLTEDEAMTEATSTEKSDMGVAPVAAPAHVTDSPVHAPDVFVNDESVPAQTTGPASVVPPMAIVHETHVALDRIITDPHSDLAVQIPAAGRGNAMTPIGSVYGVSGAEHPEAALTRKASE